jgi:TetR/AcrR family transcriptional repressor of nem operon
MQRSKRNPVVTREKLVTAAVALILRNGYHATGVDAICAEAGVTKGSFFHHFANKDEIGLAVIAWWSAMGTREYSAAWSDEQGDPLDQLHAMLDIMEGFASGTGEPYVCAIGMMAQELAATHQEIRESCAAELSVWTNIVAKLLRKAQLRHRPPTRFDPEHFAWFLNSLWQGSMLVAKTLGDQKLIVRNLKQARCHLNMLIPRAKPLPKPNPKPKNRKS